MRVLSAGHSTNFLMPQDLMKYGLIPEFIGRVPVTVTLEGLNQEALVRVLKEPKNALLKQYWKILNMDGVDLSFSDDAIEAIASLAIDRNTGARGLRSILEEIMLDIMYEIPSRKDIERCLITKECITESKPPELTLSMKPKKRSRGTSEDIGA